MRSLLLCIGFIFIVCSGQAQKTEVFGIVSDIEGTPLSGATINYKSTLGTITDHTGSFYIHTEIEETLALKIRFIGYETVDTIIRSNTENRIFVHIKMKPSITRLPKAEITAKYQNLFDNYYHHIIDFTISEDIIYILIKKGRKPYLCSANLRGTILEEYPLKEAYTGFYNSCLGGIILVGKDECAELHILDGSVFITNEFEMDYFNKYILPCKLKMDEGLVFKNISKHNKKIDYIKFEQDKNPSLLYTVYDREGERVSQSYFSDILRQYYKESLSTDLKDIDHGFNRQNIIDDGSWNGDIQDLIVTNATHELVLQYQALGLKSVTSDLFVINHKPFIFDGMDRSLVQLENSTKMEMNGFAFDLSSDFDIITDYVSNTYFLKKENLYPIKIQEQLLTIDQPIQLESIFFKERDFIYKNVLYRLGRKSMSTVKKKIFKTSLSFTP
ncbi:MAG: carboxypeptidase-like regulatory domain-containing protein [Saprospiraceae bacterium]|nr:carboxypeptidase-like regulatory domain-containing protein [Saprospiraceae bacterium]